MQEAEKSLNHLISRVERSLASDPDLQGRIDAQTEDPALPTVPSQLTANSAEEDKLRSSSGSPFEKDLQTSKVYQRLRPRDSMWSLNSSQCGSMALSKFSQLTLGDLSTVSVFRLPIWSTDISNARHYNFEPNLPMPRTLERQNSVRVPRRPVNNVNNSKEPVFSPTAIRVHSMNMKLFKESKTNIHSSTQSAMIERGRIREEEWQKEKKATLQQQTRAKAKRDSERLRLDVPPIKEQAELTSPDALVVARTMAEPSTRFYDSTNFDQGWVPPDQRVFATVAEQRYLHPFAQSYIAQRSSAAVAQKPSATPQEELATTEDGSAATPDVQTVEESRRVHEPAALVPTTLTTSQQEEILASATEDYAASTQEVDWRSFPICFYQPRSCDDRIKIEGG